MGDRRRRRTDAIAQGGFLLILVGVYPSLASFQASLFFDDVTEMQVPIRHFFGTAWGRGEFPLWCPGIYLGFPLFAEGQAGPLYPPNWLLFPWMPTWAAYSASFLLHLWVAAAGTYLWLRRGHGAMASFLGGTAFALTGFLAMHHYHLNLLQAAALTPVVLWLVDRVLDRGRPRDLAYAALAMGCLALAGHPQTTVQAGLTVGLWATARLALAPGPLAGRGKGLAAAVAVLLLGAGLYAVMVLPALEIVPLSVRAAGLSAREQMQQFVTPQTLAAAVVPSAFGTAGNATTWLSPGGFARPGLDLFWGAGVVALALAGALASRSRAAAAAAVLGGVCLVLAFGPMVPGVPALFRLPVMKGLRFPDRFGLDAALAMAALAAAGWQAAVDGHVRPRHALGAILAVAGFTVLVLGWTYRDGFGQADALGLELARDGAIAAVALGLAGEALLLARNSPRVAAALATVAVAGPLADYGHRQVPVVDPSYWDPPPTVEAIRAAECPAGICPLEASLGRVAFRDVPDAYHAAGWLNGLSRFDGAQDGLVYNLPLTWDLHAVDGILPLRPQAFLDVYQPIYYDRARSFGPLGGRWLVTGKTAGAPGLKLRTREGTLRLYEDPGALPRAFAVHRWEVIPDDGQRRKRVADGKDLRDVAILGEAPPLGTPDPPQRDPVVTVLSYGNDRVELSASLEAPGIVVLLDRFHPGWEARVDGTRADILPVDALFRGVVVGAGEHRVTFEYRPASVARGLAVSLGVLALLGLLLAWDLAAGLRGRVLAPFAAPPSGPPDSRASRWVLWACVGTVALAMIASRLLVPELWDRWVRPFGG